jgi:hypothetical protein
MGRGWEGAGVVPNSFTTKDTEGTRRRDLAEFARVFEQCGRTLALRRGESGLIFFVLRMEHGNSREV